jgi:hypothetical protein
VDLSKTIGTVALVLAVVLAAGFAVGEDGAPVTKGTAAPAAQPPATPGKTAQMRIEEREAQRRVALEEQQKRRDAYERACGKPNKSEADLEQCRAAYKRLHITQ